MGPGIFGWVQTAVYEETMRTSETLTKSMCFLNWSFGFPIARGGPRTHLGRSRTLSDAEQNFKEVSDLFSFCGPLIPFGAHLGRSGATCGPMGNTMDEPVPLISFIYHHNEISEQL